MPRAPHAVAHSPRERAARLRITEIFHSLQGEGRTTGLPTAFVRLTGCPLRCRYCDTEYAFHGGRIMEVDEILARVRDQGARHVTVTGGEPLAQPDCLALMRRLCDEGYAVSLETGGALDVSVVDPRVSIVLDLKTPGSGEVDRNLYANLEHLAPKDQIKFVLCDRRDYEWAVSCLAEHALARRCEVLFSPAHGGLEPVRLAEWILADRLEVRLQVQLHKLLWGDVPGR
jgi:7-carboxy-7-deazaguanine synthase